MPIGTHIVKDALHGDCFYLGFCEPIERTERLIHETIDYIDDAEDLAAPSTAVAQE